MMSLEGLYKRMVDIAKWNRFDIRIGIFSGSNVIF